LILASPLLNQKQEWACFMDAHIRKRFNTMKLHIAPRNVGTLQLATALLLAAQTPAAAVSLVVSPGSVSNTYPGLITLNISGLTNGETVLVQKYLDLNANAAADPGEPLADSFRVTDGGAFAIGGVTNINVPFDSNPATGAITTTLSISPPRSLANMVGQYVFIVSSPVQRFSPVSATLSITNAATAQALDGMIYNGSTPVPYAVVAVLTASTGNNGGGDWASGVIADNSGHYHVNLNPGSYMAFPTSPGYFTDMSQGVQATLTNGMSSTNNLFLTNALVTVSGTVSNASNGQPVGGLLMPIEGGNYLAITFADTNGAFVAGVAPGVWKVKVDSESVQERALVTSQNAVYADTTTGSVANANITLWKANAMFYGTITNTAGQPLANLRLSADNQNGQTEASGTTDANGNYCVAVLGGTGDWYCSPDNSNPMLAGYLLSSTFNTNLSVSQAFRQDFSALPMTAHISGHVKDLAGNPVSGIGMMDNATIGGVSYMGFVDTDSSGNYSLPAATGTWNVFPNCCGNDGLNNFGLTDSGLHWVTVPPTNAVLNLTLYPYGTPFLSSPARAGSTFAFLLSGAPGTNYTILATTNLASGNWTTFQVITLSGNYTNIQDQITNGMRYYRVLRGP